MADRLVRDGSREADPPGIAATLQEVLARAEADALTAGALLESFGPRAFGLLLILLNLPNVLFAPPALAGVAAVPTAVFGTQLLLGHARPWLPAAIAQRPIAAGALRRVLAAAGPWLARLEAAGRPRLAALGGPVALRLLGAFAILAAAIVLLPVPGTNVLPSLSLVVMAVAAMRRDGVLVLVGAALGVAGLLVALAAAGLALELLRLAWAAL